jgi:hypothetical protein
LRHTDRGLYHRNEVGARRFLPRAIYWVCCALALLSSSSTHRLAAAAADDAALIFASELTPPDRSEQPIFRFGDAARPFGWSSVVNDFNADGKPDVAVADHVAGRTSAYRLEFSISGQGVHDVTFESRHVALTIRVADVDSDNDLDVIVGTPLFGETVGVWLNDGHGNFTAGNVHDLPGTIQSSHSADTTDPLINAAALEAPPRRVAVGLPVAFRAPPAGSAHLSVVRYRCARRSYQPASQSSPRAPPAALRTLSS